MVEMGEKMMYLLVVMLLMMMICRSCNGGEIHRVGGSAGWSSTNLTLNPTLYKSWAASKLFRLGDTILFEYNKEFHNVVRVTHKNFNACNLTAPYVTWATGNDTFTITRPGHYYFVCGFPGHCSAGQKVDIRVPKNDPAQGPARSPLDPPSDSLGPSTIASSPAQPQPPKKSASSSSIHSYFNLCFCGVVAFAIAAASFYL